MSNTTVTSKQYSLNWRDVLKGLVLAVITPVLTIVMASLNAGELTFNWKLIGATAVSALIAYLIKNFLTPSAIVVTDADKTTVDMVKEGEAKVTVTPT